MKSAGQLLRGRGLIVGCGANVIDKVLTVRWLPSPDATKTLVKRFEGKEAGGVTFNHLAWAAALGSETALMAAHPPPGACPNSDFFAQRMSHCGVGAQFITRRPDYRLGESSVLLEEKSGERFIVMDPGSTGSVGVRWVEHAWAVLQKDSPKLSILTLEISQVQLGSLRRLSELAQTARPSPMLAVDIDIEPVWRALESLGGTWEDLFEILGRASFVKASRSAAREILAAARPRTVRGAAADDDPVSLARAFAGATGARLAAVTRGADAPIFAMRELAVAVPAPHAARVLAMVDFTGAGDAFFGAVLNFLDGRGAPTSARELEAVGQRAAVCARLCAARVGALPPPRRELKLALGRSGVLDRL